MEAVLLQRTEVSNNAEICPPIDSNAKCFDASNALNSGQ